MSVFSDKDLEELKEHETFAIDAEQCHGFDIAALLHRLECAENVASHHDPLTPRILLEAWKRSKGEA